MNSRTLALGVIVLSALGLAYSCSDYNTETASTTSDSLSPEKLVERGNYLVSTMGCGDCHSPKNMGPQGPMLDTAHMLSGFPATRPLPVYSQEEIKKGFAIMNADLTSAAGPWGVSYAANLTSDSTGIGLWTEEQFRIALTHGKFKGMESGRPLMPPMPWENFRHLHDEDLKAMFAYLKSTKPVHNVVPAYQPPGS